MSSEYKPTPAQYALANHLQTLCRELLAGNIAGIGIATCDQEGDPSCFYLNSADVPVLRGPIDRLRVMYEANQDFADESKRLRTVKHNTSYGIH